MNNKELSQKAILHFIQVSYEVFGKIIPYEQAGKGAHILMRLLHMTITNHEIRTGKKTVTTT
jgi:hypothetical protein